MLRRPPSPPPLLVVLVAILTDVGYRRFFARAAREIAERGWRR